MPKISALPAMTAIAADDELPINDVSAGATKKVANSLLTGNPDFGWTTAAETWVYSSWSSTTRIGILTVPSDATLKYTPGMRIRISQSTGGTKYGIIHAVSATTLTIFFPSGTTLNNEAVSAAWYSSVAVPFGFNADESIWSISYSDTAQRTQAAPVAGTWYNLNSASLVIGIGVWDLELMVQLQANGSLPLCQGAFSSSTSSISDNELCVYTEVAGTVSSAGAKQYARKAKNLASQTTYYLITRLFTGGTANNIYNRGEVSPTILKATSAYL